jgi:hypothetical protein
MDQRKQAKLQWLQNPEQTNRDNLQSVRHETSRIFRKKKREHLKGKIMSWKLIIKAITLEICKGIKELKNGYHPRINIIKDENGNLLADPHNVLNRWKKFFNQVLNEHGVHDVRQIDIYIYMAEPLVPEPSLVEVEIAIGKLKSFKSPGTDNIPAELIKAGGET